MKIGHTLNRDKRPEILGWSPSRDCQARARSLSKAQTRMSAGFGEKGSAFDFTGPTFTCKAGLAAMEHKIGAESATIALLRAATDYNNVAM